jgi:hypothetical protein
LQVLVVDFCGLGEGGFGGDVKVVVVVVGAGGVYSGTDAHDALDVSLVELCWRGRGTFLRARSAIGVFTTVYFHINNCKFIKTSITLIHKVKPLLP